METNNKLREALTKILNLTNSLDEECAVDPVEIRDIARDALAEPIRNCEVGTAAEQMERYDRYCAHHGSNTTCSDATYLCGDCPLLDQKTNCEFAWAQMPYEGGTKSEDDNYV